MKRVEEYLRRARECDVLWQTGSVQSERDAIRAIADTWRRLARERSAAIGTSRELPDDPLPKTPNR
jgi:hypothetical protein